MSNEIQICIKENDNREITLLMIWLQQSFAQEADDQKNGLEC